MIKAIKRMLVKGICLIFVFSVIIFVSCGKEKSAGEFEELIFAVNDSLLGPVYIDSTLGFTFHPPTGWEIVSDTIMAEAKYRLSEVIHSGDSIQIVPRRFFIDVQNGSACCLSQVRGLAVGNDGLLLYESQLKTKFAGTSITEGAFRIGDLYIFQYLITDPQRVIFKLLCGGPQVQTFQVDYVLLRSVYPRYIKAIESSIGSFQILL